MTLMNTHYESSIRKFMVTIFLLGVDAIASFSGSTTLNIIGNKHNSESDCYVFKTPWNERSSGNDFGKEKAHNIFNVLNLCMVSFELILMYVE